MASLIPDSAPTCARCSRTLQPGALACDRCHTLVHAGEMERIAAEARALEAQSRLPEARDRWLSIVPLLPQDSEQAKWIRQHAQELQNAAPAAQRPEAPGTKHPWVKRLGPLAPLAILLAKFKGVLLWLFKLKFLLSFASYIGLYWAWWGPKFGIGFAVQILIHEMGHYIDIKRRGLPADMPMFLPGIGAYVRWQAMGVPVETRAAISLAGPLAGALAAGGCALIWQQTGDGMWAALARIGAWINVLNLIPVFIFDGAKAMDALRKTECLLVMAAAGAIGYVTGEWIFYFVGAGSLWRAAVPLFARKRPQEMQTLGLEQNVPVMAPITSTGPPDLAGRHESHGIAAYYLAVLMGLGALLWLLPGHGSIAR